MASVNISGDVSGAISIAAPSAAGSGTLTLPVATDTLVGKATTDTLTNKSIAATQLTGTIAASALPAGSVLQVVSATYSTTTSNSTSTYADTGLTATITPKFSSSKILVLVSQNGLYKTTANTQNAISLKLQRSGTDVNVFAIYAGYTNTALELHYGSSTNYLDSPATTSATIYKTQFKNVSNTASVACQQDGDTSTITLMEIAG